MSTQIKINGDRTLFAKRLFFLAWQACRGPMGMGVFQDRPSAEEDQVFNNVLSAGDYACAMGRGLGEVYGDYVFGRMMKFGFTIRNDDVLVFRDSSFRSDYQAFARVYRDLTSLLDATAKSIGMSYEVVND